MRLKDCRSVSEMLGVLMNYYRTLLTDEVIGLYLDRFESCDLRVFAAAVAQHLEDPARGQYFPKINELAQHIRRIETPHTLELTEGEAWAMVLQEVSRCSTYLAPQFDHPIVAKAVAAVGGLRRICMAEEREIGVVQGQFFRAFSSLIKRERDDREWLPAVKELRRELLGERPAYLRLVDRSAQPQLPPAPGALTAGTLSDGPDFQRWSQAVTERERQERERAAQPAAKPRTPKIRKA